jgi:hypothetical protein
MEVKKARSLLINKNYAVVAVVVPKVSERFYICPIERSGALANRDTQRYTAKKLIGRTREERESASGPIVFMFYKAIEGFDVLRETTLEFLEQLTKAELVGISSARGRIDIQVHAEHVMLWTVGD